MNEAGRTASAYVKKVESDILPTLYSGDLTYTTNHPSFYSIPRYLFIMRGDTIVFFVLIKRFTLFMNLQLDS